MGKESTRNGGISETTDFYDEDEELDGAVTLAADDYDDEDDDGDAEGVVTLTTDGYYDDEDEDEDFEGVVTLAADDFEDDDEDAEGVVTLTTDDYDDEDDEPAGGIMTLAIDDAEETDGSGIAAGQDKADAGRRAGNLKKFAGKQIKGIHSVYTITGKREKTKSGEGEIYNCVDADGKERIVKIYRKTESRKMKGQLLEILKVVQDKHSEYLTDILEYGEWDLDEGSRVYVVMPVYEKFPVEEYEFRADLAEDAAYRKKLTEFVEQFHQAIVDLHLKGADTKNKEYVVHADIKLENIMWDQEKGHLVLIDFSSAALTDAPDQEVKPRSVTHFVAPKEYQNRENGKLSFASDYFQFGFAVAKLIAGPGVSIRDYQDMQGRFGDVRLLGACYVSEYLPEDIQNLIRGLLFEHKRYRDEINAFRWNQSKVEQWLKLEKSGPEGIEKAKTFSQVNVEGDVQSHKKEPGHFRDGQSASIRLDGELYTVTSLQELADRCSEHLEDGLKCLTGGARELSVSRMGDAYYTLEEYTRDMKQAEEQGDSVRYIYSRFLLEQCSKVSEEDIYWPGLPMADIPEVDGYKAFALERFGFYFLSGLKAAKKYGYDWDEWWDYKRNDEQKTKYTDMYHVFEFLACNGLTMYLNFLGKEKAVDDKILQQCKTVEWIFQDAFREGRTRFSDEDISQMYLLAYLLSGKKKYNLDSSHSFGNLGEFVSYVEGLSKDENTVGQVEKVWRSVTKGGSYAPDFHAWLSLQNPGKAIPVKHELKGAKEA